MKNVKIINITKRTYLKKIEKILIFIYLPQFKYIKKNKPVR